MTALAHWGIFLVAACLEVAGDALIRRGLKGAGVGFIVAGFLLLGVYGLVVNTANLEFSRLIGVYIAVFSLMSILTGKFYFGESISTATWAGLAIIVLGGLVIQFGGK